MLYTIISVVAIIAVISLAIININKNNEEERIARMNKGFSPIHEQICRINSCNRCAYNRAIKIDADCIITIAKIHLDNKEENPVITRDILTCVEVEYLVNPGITVDDVVNELKARMYKVSILPGFAGKVVFQLS